MKILSIIKLSGIILFLTNNLIAQKLNLSDNIITNLFTPNIQADLFTEFNPDLDLYRIDRNPSNLILSERKTNLLISYTFDQLSGDRKRIFDEDKKFLNKAIIDLTYRMDTNETIHSFINFYNSTSKDRMYVENRYPYRGNPYILADANAGDFGMNMLNISTDYANRFYQNLTLGVQIIYCVGESLKKFFPKPTSNYRDLGLKIGLTYELDSKNFIGISGNYYNLYEEIASNDNSRSPRILRFRGLDNPLVFAGTNGQNRYYKNDGYGGGFELKHDFNEKINIILSGNGFSGQEIVTDGTTLPKDNGKWVEKNYESKLVFNYFGKSNYLKVGILFEYNNQNAIRPTRPEIILNRKNSIISPFICTDFKLNDNMKGYILYQFFIVHEEVYDYINYIDYTLPSTSHSIEIGTEYDFSENLSVFLNYNPCLYKPVKNQINTITPTNDYFNYFEPDIKLSQTEFINHNVTFKTVYHFGMLGDLGLVIQNGLITDKTSKYRNNFIFSTFINLFII